MAYCRDCETEFPELLPWCPNCGTPNDEESDDWEVEFMGDDGLVAIFNAHNEVEALLYRTMLEEAGIDVIERPMEEPWLEGVKWQGLHSQLLVREEEATHASALVNAFHLEAESGELSAEIPQDQVENAGTGTDERHESKP